MWRALFLAIGICCCAVGIECLLIEQATIITSSDPVAPGQQGGPQVPTTRVIKPPDWAPWSLLAAGSVVMIYSFTIPRRVME